MQVERCGSLSLAQFPDSLPWEREQGSVAEDLAQLMDQLANTSNGLLGTGGYGDSPRVQRSNSGAYLALVLEKALGRKQPGTDASGLAIAATTRVGNVAVKADADPMFAVLAQQPNHTPCREDEEDGAKRTRAYGTFLSGLQLDTEYDHALARHIGNGKRMRSTTVCPGEPDLSSLGDGTTVSRKFIEPKISKVDVDRIPMKEARRVLNNRKSAQKSYLRKKEKMKNMEERLAKYEVQLANLNRDLVRLRAEYEKVLEENRQLKGQAGQESAQNQMQPPASSESRDRSAYWP